MNTNKGIEDLERQLRAHRDETRQRLHADGIDPAAIDDLITMMHANHDRGLRAVGRALQSIDQGGLAAAPGALGTQK